MSLFSKEKYGHLIEDWAKKVEERLKNATADEIEAAAFVAIRLTEGFAESEIKMSPDNMLDYPDCLMETIKTVENYGK